MKTKNNMPSNKKTLMKIELAPLNLLTILFIGLKLTNHIDWSWWWVLSPTLFQIGLGISILLIIGLAGLVFAFLDSKR